MARASRKAAAKLRRWDAAVACGLPVEAVVLRWAETVWAEDSPWQAEAVTPGVAEEGVTWVAVRTRDRLQPKKGPFELSPATRSA